MQKRRPGNEITGRKIEAAVKLREQGTRLAIVSEETLGEVRRSGGRLSVHRAVGASNPRLQRPALRAAAEPPDR